MVTLAVVGSAHRLVPAERATVTVRIRVEDVERGRAVEAVAALHRRVSAEAAAHVADGSATRWSADQVQARSGRRYVEEERREQPVQVAGAEVMVRFADFAALSAWLNELTLLDGVEIPGVAWSVTDARRAEVKREVRAAATRQLQEHAAEYAAELGGGSVELVALYEPGLRPGSTAREASRWTAQGESRGEQDRLSLRPEEIEIAATLDADFVLRT